MTTGFRNSAGADLDDLFEPYTSGTKPAATGFRLSNGVDLRERFQPRGGLQKISNVGYRNAGGVDLSSLWASKGGVAYSIEGLDGKSVTAGDTAQTNQSTVAASASVALSSSGTWSATAATSKGGEVLPDPVNGSWLTMGGAAGDYDALITVSHSGHADRQASNGAPVWSSLATTRSASLMLPSIAANNSIIRFADATIRLQIRRRATGQVVSDTSLSMHLSTNGWA